MIGVLAGRPQDDKDWQAIYQAAFSAMKTVAAKLAKCRRSKRRSKSRSRRRSIRVKAFARDMVNFYQFPMEFHLVGGSR